MVFLLIGVGGKGAFGQTPYDIPDPITPLQIGDTIPEWLWHLPLQVVNHPEGKGAITLDDYRDKLILLDFWATWCGPCVLGLRKLDSIARLPLPEKGRYTVIPVTYQRESEISGAIRRFGWSLQSVHTDKALSQAFPHSGLPHQVWIRSGRVFAMPPPQFATAELIGKSIAGEIAALPNDPLPFPVPVIPAGTDGFRTLTEGNPRYFSQAPCTVPQEGGALFLLGNARLVRDLFGYAYEPLVSKYHSRLEPPGTPGSSIELEVGDSLRRELSAVPTPEREYDSPEGLHKAWCDWVERHTYVYAHYVPGGDPDAVDWLLHLREALDDRFRAGKGIRARVESRPKAMARIRLTAPVEQVVQALAATVGQHPRPYEALRSAIRAALPRGVPLMENAMLDGASPGWSIELPREPTIEELNGLLAPYGIAVDIQEENVPLLVISEDMDKH